MSSDKTKKFYKKIINNSIAFWIYFIFLIFTVIYIISLKYYTTGVISLFNLPADYLFKFIWEPNFKGPNQSIDFYFNIGFFASALIAFILYLYGLISACIIKSRANKIYAISKVKSGFFLFNSIFMITGIWIIFYLISWSSLYREFKKYNS
ncbi:MAG: hypothetical protein ACRDCD_00305 [Mycoplasmoidaceae bacterium]